MKERERETRKDEGEGEGRTHNVQDTAGRLNATGSCISVIFIQCICRMIT